ncbi:DUF4112 domain-containing protein [Kovacikia minuta CCNUW1]|uniref:DUF4112 domain-containing protein n=1 Tax=Kovacikia minuta TaxID=2931930 RepID=UPI001CC9EC84|nr:DUF4112 domain-containing protein [Kovacikia minuta]UBF24996.1 DUF4112 domain-containing protein [Kovacikia minuta CCNUW1]
MEESREMPANSQVHSKSSALQRVRLLSRVLDNAIPIPGTSYRIGLDPLLGLIPGGGDIAGAVASAYIVLESARFGLPRKTLMQMLTNLFTDAVVGVVPFLGDFFDVTWKANSRNVALLEAHLKNPRPQRAADRLFLAFLVIALLLFVAAVAAIATLVVGLIWRAIRGQ